MKNNGKTPEIRFDGFVGEWDVDILNELAEVKDSARISNKYWTQKGVPYVRASDISNNDLTGVLYLSQETYEEYKKITGAPIQGDVLFNGGGEIGRAVLKKDETPLYVQGGAVLYVKTSSSKTLNGQYLATFFETNLSHSYIEVASVGGTMKHFTLKPAQQMPVPFPSLAEQKQIGAFFERLDALIALYRRRRDNLANVKKSLLEKMLPRNGAKVPEIRFDGFVGEWETRKLGELFSERVENMPDGELISVTIRDGIKKFSELGRHDNSNEDKSKYKRVCVGDIAYNSMRMWQGASGYSPYEGIVSPAYTVLVSKDGVDSKCMSYLFKRPDITFLFQTNSQGITSDNWNLKYPKFSEISVPISPYIEEQQQIGAFFQELDALIALSSRLLEKIQNVKKSFLSKAFVSSISSAEV